MDFKKIPNWLLNLENEDIEFIKISFYILDL